MSKVNLPLKIDKDINYFTLPSKRLQEQITKIERSDRIPDCNQVFVYFKNEFSVSIIQGFVTFNAFEIAVKKDGRLLEYFTDEDGFTDVIYRTRDPQELVQIMEHVSHLPNDYVISNNKGVLCQQEFQAVTVNTNFKTRNTEKE